MQKIDIQSHTLTALNIEIGFEELAKKLQTGQRKEAILTTAEKTLLSVNNIWNPAIVYRWLPVDQDKTQHGAAVICDDNRSTVFSLGHSAIFIKNASYVLVAAYSVGSEIDEKIRQSNEKGELLVSYILDLIGLLVLEKTGNMVKGFAEEKAVEFGWGVSPFLSPGSIHGWELEEQLKLCSLLPLDHINVHIRDDAVLVPFKSLSCLIGIGVKYKTSLVGTTCQVCSKNSDCPMKLS